LASFTLGVVRVICFALLLTTSALSADWSSLYEPAYLENQHTRLAQDVDLVIAQEIQPFLTVSQAHAFFGLKLNLPATAEPGANPLDCYSPHDGQITIPLLTIAFVEEMSEAYAWLWANHYSSLTVDEYIGMLRNRPPSQFPGNRYPSPLLALHIPADAMNDPTVAHMAARVRGTTLSFLLLHQFGHLNYRTSAEEAAMRHDRIEAREEMADAFALEVMKKNSEIPAGLLMLIHGMLYLPAEAPKNHPVSNQRLKAMADFLDIRVHEFSEGRPDGRLATLAIQSLATHIRTASLFLDDAAGQQLWAEQGSQTTVANLVPRRVGVSR
jgi:hypothetical protein